VHIRAKQDPHRPSMFPALWSARRRRQRDPNHYRVTTMKNRFLLTCCLIGVGWTILGTLRPWNHFQPNPERVFVKTFDCPEGKMVEVVPSDDTPVVQWWWYEQDRHLAYHEDGKLTYVDTPTLRRIVRNH
jgi:hypothetical protein